MGLWARRETNKMDIVKTASDVGIILGCLTSIAAIIYWAIKAKLKDEFCNQQDCEKKHTAIDAGLLAYRKDISDDIREIKEIVVRIESRFFDWVSKQK